MKKLLLMLSALSLGFATIDINHASAAELETIKGVGAKTAQAIIAYKTSHGCFDTVDGLVNVKGIGSKTLDKNRAMLETKPCK